MISFGFYKYGRILCSQSVIDIQRLNRFNFTMMLLSKIKLFILLLFLSIMGLSAEDLTKLTREEMKKMAAKLYSDFRSIIEHSIEDFRAIAKTDEGIQTALDYLEKKEFKDLEEALNNTSAFRKFEDEVGKHNPLELYKDEVNSIRPEFAKEHPGVKPSFKNFNLSEATKKLIADYWKAQSKFYDAAFQNGLGVHRPSYIELGIPELRERKEMIDVMKYLAKIEKAGEMIDLFMKPYDFWKFVALNDLM